MNKKIIILTNSYSSIGEKKNFEPVVNSLSLLLSDSGINVEVTHIKAGTLTMLEFSQLYESSTDDAVYFIESSLKETDAIYPLSSKAMFTSNLIAEYCSETESFRVIRDKSKKTGEDKDIGEIAERITNIVKMR